MKLRIWIFSFLLLVSSCSAAKQKNETKLSVNQMTNDDYDSYDDDYYYDEEYNTVSDPFEKINRKMFDFNIFLLTNVVKPLIITYDTITTQFIRERLYNVVDRFYDITYLFNSILQLDYVNTYKTVATFSLNMTFGFFGFFNVAKDLGVYREERTFSQTMGIYGIGSGPFLMVPFFGPYTIREGFGKLTDMGLSPFSINLVKFNHEYFSVTPFYVDVIKYIGKYGVELNDTIKLNENFIQKAFDPYIFMRDSYMQNINYKIKNIKEQL